MKLHIRLHFYSLWVNGVILKPLLMPIIMKETNFTTEMNVMKNVSNQSIGQEKEHI